LDKLINLKKLYLCKNKINPNDPEIAKLKARGVEVYI
jgi:hypothetical protein